MESSTQLLTSSVETDEVVVVDVVEVVVEGATSGSRLQDESTTVPNAATSSVCRRALIKCIE